MKISLTQPSRQGRLVMSKFYFVLLLLLSNPSLAQDEFITRWFMGIPGAAEKTLSIGVITTGTVRYEWEWVGSDSRKGSGTFFGDQLTIPDLPSTGFIDLKIGPVGFRGLRMDWGADRLRLVSVRNWGTASWRSMERAFYGCQNMTVTATDLPNLSSVTNMDYAFAGTGCVDIPNIGSWDVSKVQSMKYMFYGAAYFNSPLDNWNTSRVRYMDGMFQTTLDFNQPLDHWDVRQVVSMQLMFSGARAFNQPIDRWDVSNVLRMALMFQRAKSFNQPLGNWNVRRVTDMRRMFDQADKFNQDLHQWNLENVTDMSDMLTNTNISCENVTYTLQGWANNPSLPRNITLGAGTLTYGKPGTTALEKMRNEKGWKITIGPEVDCAPLSVSLTYFKVSSQNSTVALRWETASEQNNDYFQVERSSDAHTWEVVARVTGAGTINSVRKYETFDTAPMPGASFYRLKIVEFSGHTDYSQMKSVFMKNNSTSFVYPNPASHSITLSKVQKGDIKVFNSAGFQVLHKKVDTENPNIFIGNLPQGTYMIRAQNGWNQTFFKQNSSD